jgi:hypothetical protein
LAFLRDEKRIPADRDYVAGVVRRMQLFMKLVYVGAYPAVLLLDRPDLEAGCLNSIVMEHTSVALENLDAELDDDFIPCIEALRRLEEARTLLTPKAGPQLQPSLAGSDVKAFSGRKAA